MDKKLEENLTLQKGPNTLKDILIIKANSWMKLPPAKLWGEKMFMFHLYSRAEQIVHAAPTWWTLHADGKSKQISIVFYFIPWKQDSAPTPACRNKFMILNPHKCHQPVFPKNVKVFTFFLIEEKYDSPKWHQYSCMFSALFLSRSWNFICVGTSVSFKLSKWGHFEWLIWKFTHVQFSRT